MDKLIEVMLTGGALTTPVVVTGLLLTIKHLNGRVEAKDALILKITETSIQTNERSAAAITELRALVQQLSQQLGRNLGA